MKLFLSAVILLLLLSPSAVQAWGPDGHQIVCMIAEARMTPVSKAAVRVLLDGASISDVDVNGWADRIRSDWPESGVWHFVDIPFDAEKYDEKRDGQNGNNVIDRVDYFVSVLNKNKATQLAQAEDLIFLVHFLGDIHQPMHCIDRHGDRGGNSRLVFLLDRPMASNLHAVWDSQILRLKKGDTPNDKYAQLLNVRITPAQATQWEKGTTTDWANETHVIAKESAYKGVPAEGPPPKLDQKYVDAAGEVIEHQLQRSGVRLAMILNDLYK